MTMTDDQAAAAIHGHHSQMAAELRRRVDAVAEAARDGRPIGDSHAALAEYLDGEVLPHAAAEEGALYPAGDTAASALLVRAMRDEHVNLISHVAALRVATEPVMTAGLASAILALFESHLHKENDLLVPALVADPHVSMGSLLAGMHELVG